MLLRQFLCGALLFLLNTPIMASDQCIVQVPDLNKGFRKAFEPFYGASIEMLYPLLRQGDPTDTVITILKAKGYTPVRVDPNAATSVSGVPYRKLDFDFKIGFFFEHYYNADMRIGTIDANLILSQFDANGAISARTERREKESFHGRTEADIDAYLSNLVVNVMPACTGKAAAPVQPPKPVDPSFSLSVKLSCAYYDVFEHYARSGSGRYSYTVYQTIAYHSSIPPVRITPNAPTVILPSTRAGAPEVQVSLKQVSPFSAKPNATSYFLKINGDPEITQEADVMRIDVNPDNSLEFRYFDRRLAQSVAHPQLMSFNYSSKVSVNGSYICLLDFNDNDPIDSNQPVLNSIDIDGYKWVAFSIK